MNQVATTDNRPEIAVRRELDTMEGQFKAALPAHIPPQRFARVVMTAIQQTPELMECDRRSLWGAAMKAAQDGLLPDGREGAMVVRRAWDKESRQSYKAVSWQPMISGIRKKVRNSGEIATWDAHVVHENDAFEFELGDEPFIRHKPALTNRGKPIAAYSVATLKGGEKSREVMPIEDVYAIRDQSDAWQAFSDGKIKTTPWASNEGEMIRKTVARRHSKVLPMSTDLDDLMRRDDELYDFSGARERQEKQAAPTIAKPTVDDALNAFAAGPMIEHQPDQEGEAEAGEPEEVTAAAAPAQFKFKSRQDALDWVANAIDGIKKAAGASAITKWEQGVAARIEALRTDHPDLAGDIDRATNARLDQFAGTA